MAPSAGSITRDPDFLAFQETVRGEYALDRELGRGGMGVVYLARELSLDRLVAVKVLPPSMPSGPSARDRFIREARTAAGLSHPNIVPVFRADERDGFAFFTMAYVDGESLGHRLRRGPMAPTAVARIVREVGWALGYAHGRGVVHRDIKPDNILLDRDSGRAMVTDFGIAHLVRDHASLTAGGLIVGSAHFMSPEQAAGEKVDGRSDLYSLGIVAYLALSGRLPFDAESLQAVMAQQITRTAPPLLGAGLPEPLVRVVERLLAKDPAQRFETGEALANAVTATDHQTSTVPAAVRLWINRGAERRNTALVLFALLSLVVGWSPSWLLVIPIVQLLQLVANTHPALRAGFSLDDLRQGLRQHLLMRLEERQVEAITAQSPISRWLGHLSSSILVAGAVVLTVTPLFTLDAHLLEPGWMVTHRSEMRLAVLAIKSAATFGLGTLAVGIGFGIARAAFPLGTIPRKLGIADRLRLRFWDGIGGRLVAALAGLGVRPTLTSRSGSHTEAALAAAIQDLARDLPVGVQRHFPDLGKIIARLEHEGAALRQELARLERPGAERLSSAGALSTGDLDRAQIRRRLADVTQTLDAIRVGMLRLHARMDDRASLESALDAAHQIELRIAAYSMAVAEVDRVIRATPS